MPKQIKINQIVPVYSAHDENSKTTDFIYEGNVVRFNREKRRNGIDWMEIYFQGKKSYIKKDFSKMYILRKSKLIDDSCTVVFYESKNGENYRFNEAFTPHQFDDMNQGSVQMKRIYDEAQRQESVTLYYNKSTVEVSKRIFARGEEIIITNKEGEFLEVLYGKKLGYILSSVMYYETRNWWMIVVGVSVILGIVGGLFYASIETGWSVSGSFLAIPAIIIIAVIVFCIKLILAVFNIIFENIRKRL